jgi:hypothetical protein
MAFSARFFCRTAYIPTPRRTRTKIALPTAIPAIKPVLMEVRLSESEEKYNFIREEREREREKRERWEMRVYADMIWTTLKNVRRWYKIVGSKIFRRFVSLITQIKPNFLNLWSIKIFSFCWKESQLHLKIVVNIEEGVLKGNRTGSEAQCPPHAHFKWVKHSYIGQFPEKGSSEV